MNARIDRLRALLEEPLLVTNPKNVIYLAGFESSNAALLVDQERVQLFTDFRYIEAARAVEGVELVQTKRGVIGALAEKLSGPIGFEATNVVYSDYMTLSYGRLFEQWRAEHHSAAENLTFDEVGMDAARR